MWSRRSKSWTSRIKDWKIKLPDTIADNGSSARFMVGGRMTPIATLDMRLTV
jgi:2-keto-4-pentenoate hydratase